MRLRSWLGRFRRRNPPKETPADSEPPASASNADTSPISSDRPIQHPDEDRFGVDPFAQMVARSVLGQRSSEGTVIAVNGPWGSGKSSVFNLVSHHLSQWPSGACIEIVRFNPWWFTGSPALARAFFSTIASALGRTLKQDGEAALTSFLERLGSLNTYTEATARMAERGVASGLAYFALGERSLEEDHRKIAEALAKQEKSFLIVMDDIDRLSPDETLLIFGLVKSFGRLPRVTYLLAFDRLLIERLLQERFPSEGAEYLEKILQAVFDLPPTPPEILRQTFLGEAYTLFDIAEPNMGRFMNLFFDVVVPNLSSPRNVIRLAGSLRVTLPAIKSEVDHADFMSIETLRLFWPEVYRNIRDHPDMVCRGVRDHGHGNAERAKAEVSAALLAGVEEAEQPYVKTALQRLFPRLEGVWGNGSYGTDWDESWELARRVCSRRHFPTYFQYAVNPDALPSSIRDDLVSRAGDEAAIRQMLLEALRVRRPNGGTRAALMLEELRLLTDHVSTEDLPALLRALFAVADEIDVPEDEVRGFRFDSNPQRLHWLLNKLVFDRYPIDEASSALLAGARHAAPGWCADLAERCLRPYQQKEGAEGKELTKPIVSMRPTNRVADGAPGSGQARPRCQPSVPSVICRKGLAASRC